MSPSYPYRRWEDCATCLRNAEERARWRTLDWSEFCSWLAGRGAARETRPDFDESLVFGSDDGAEFASTYLDFEDGSAARLTSNVSPPTPHYSDVTPGGPGHVELPTVMVREARGRADAKGS